MLDLDKIPTVIPPGINTSCDRHSYIFLVSSRCCNSLEITDSSFTSYSVDFNLLYYVNVKANRFIILLNLNL